MTLKEFQKKLRSDGYAGYQGARRAAGKHGFNPKEKALAHKAIDRKYGKK